MSDNDKDQDESDNERVFDIEPTNEVPKGRTTRSTDEIAPLSGQAQLVVLAGDKKGKRFSVQGDVVIGRHPASTVWLHDGGISARHALISVENEKHVLRDLGSRNGTRINGVSIQERELSFGDKIAVGASTMLLFTYADPLEEELLRLQKMEAIGRLAGGVAHEFNNLLAVVLTNLTLLQEPEALEPAEIKSCVNEARQAALRGAELTRQMLDYSRISGSDRTLVDLSALVQEVVGLIKRLFDRSIDIEHEIEPRVAVQGDRVQLHQVLMNLCLNAGDAMPRAGRLRVTVRSMDLGEGDLEDQPSLEPGRYAVLEVTDTGKGMSEEILERAFEPFFTTKSAGKGSGLGLAMVKGLVQEHGGEIEIESELTQGTTARVLLPMLSEPAKITSDVPPMPGEEPFSGLVLVVDDDELILRTLRRTLRKLGFETLTASGGEEALRLYKEHGERIRLVLLDVIMPGMSGQETFTALKELDPEVKVLISSGYTEEKVAKDLLAEGALDFLKKPYELERLKFSIVKALLGAV